ncbi:hypothetical protein [Brevundimonas sp.]|uniref:hypothetical protein n=1 Tax=Brevundimonas sp. TaxID=1871086 RepID=UPI001A1FA4F7|nr:hypothetical protein [Brevundimonas sp.]MBJ7485964.1 hypothetical protein [Brevundimonas sp.]
MTPEFCGNCRKLNQPCASGRPDAKGRLCPQIEHACRTTEGAAVWSAVSRAGGWTGGGMTPRRVDRAAVRARLEGIDGWIVETLIDTFEPAALAAAVRSEARKKLKPKT